MAPTRPTTFQAQLMLAPQQPQLPFAMPQGSVLQPQQIAGWQASQNLQSAYHGTSRSFSATRPQLVQQADQQWSSQIYALDNERLEGTHLRPDFSQVTLAWAPRSFVDEAHRTFARAAAHALPSKPNIPLDLLQRYQREQEHLYHLRQTHQQSSRGLAAQQYRQHQQQQQQQQHNQTILQSQQQFQAQQQQLQQHQRQTAQLLQQQQWEVQWLQQHRLLQQQQEQEQEQQQQHVPSVERRMKPQLRPATSTRHAAPASLFTQAPVPSGSPRASASPSLRGREDPHWSRETSDTAVEANDGLAAIPTGPYSSTDQRVEGHLSGEGAQPDKAHTSSEQDQLVQRRALREKDLYWDWFAPCEGDPPAEHLVTYPDVGDYGTPESMRAARASAEPSRLPAPARVWLSRALRLDDDDGETSPQSPSAKRGQAKPEAARRKWAQQMVENQPTITAENVGAAPFQPRFFASPTAR